MSADSKQPAPIVPAATVLLLRDRPEGLEVFMVVRHHQIDFASGALVFPGGKADPQDFEPELRELADGGNTDDKLFAAEVSALRETFEECGILLAHETATDKMIDGVKLASLQKYRKPIVDGEMTFAALLKSEGLRLQCGDLAHFAHWITPDMMPKRFDTHFSRPRHLKIISHCMTGMSLSIRSGLDRRLRCARHKTANAPSFFQPCAT